MAREHHKMSMLVSEYPENLWADSIIVLGKQGNAFFSKFPALSRLYFHGLSSGWLCHDAKFSAAFIHNNSSFYIHPGF
jgi:hypothetical protein